MYLKLSRSLFVTALFWGACTVHAADTCADLRSRIEANITGKGVTNFSVTVVEDAATVTGQVVGTCGNGAMKIVYSRGVGAVALPAASPSPATQAKSVAKPAAKPAAAPVATKPSKGPGILTECKDGTVSVGGNCR